MMNIYNEKDILYIELEGHIDSTNAVEVEKNIFEYPNFSSYEKIRVKAEELKYISSAGLRIILKIKKMCDDLSIYDVSSDVYEVFEMTGFTEMIDIKKGFRKFSVDGCKVLGEGSNGIVYRYNEEIIVKVYKNSNALDEIKRERILARKALILGIPTAIPFDVVKVGDKYGSVFELLNAQSFSKLIKTEPEKTDYYIGLFVDLLKKIHSTVVDKDDMTDMKRVAIDWVEYLESYLPKDQYDKLHNLVINVSERDTMIHGDYHTNNVEMQNGEVILIDMDTLAYGHPVFEFASIFLGFVGFGETNPDVTFKFLKIPYEKAKELWGKTLKMYFNNLSDSEIEIISCKAMIIGYTRLLRRTIKRIGFDDPEGLVVINNCKAKLSELLPKVDTLDF